MSELKNYDLSMVSLIILIFIYISAYNHHNKVMTDYKIYFKLVRINILLLIVEVFCWAFNGLPGYANNICNILSCLTLFIIEPEAAILWIGYIDFRLFRDEVRIKKIKNITSSVFAVNAALSLLSIYTSWIFYIDSSNLYHRGQYYGLHIFICYGIFAYGIYILIKNRKNTDKKTYYSMLLFIVPLLAGSVLQALFYGFLVIWTGMMISLLIIYINIQDNGLNIDYLTGVFNRRQLDNYIRIKARTRRQIFISAILIDIDRFKQINDNFGHTAGDAALREAADILRKSINRDDFLARMGGDEFIIMSDTENRDRLEDKVKKIRYELMKFNDQGTRPYKLGFSIGYDLYESRLLTEPDDLIRNIDMLMYADKKRSFNS